MSFYCRTSKKGNFEERSKEPDLLIFGYSAKLFKDDVRAQEIEDNKHLIPWMGDSSTMIDRFDVRGYLSNIPIPGSSSRLEYEDASFEKELNEERFRDLSDAMEEQEREMQRLRSELESEGAFNQVPFSYDDDNFNCDMKKSDEEQEPNDFQVPPTLVIPVGLNLPSSMKQHQVIEKTALFISKTGPQTEIRLKIQHANDSLFAFLDLDCPLNQYYRYLLSVIKSGQYSPIISQELGEKELPKKTVSDSDSDSDGDYLHPSLLGSRSTSTSSANKKNNVAVETSNNDDMSKQDHNKSMSLLPPPPPALEVIIEKLAEKVAETGDVFESNIRSRQDSRFDFLNPGHVFHAHYVKRKIHHLQQNHLKVRPIPEGVAGTKEKEISVRDCPEPGDDRISSPKANKNLSFTMKCVKNDLKSNFASLDFDDDNQEIESLIESTTKNEEKPKEEKEALQESRRRKAALFLKMVQQREGQDKDGVDESPSNGTASNSCVISTPTTAGDKTRHDSRRDSRRSPSRGNKKKKHKRSRSRSRERDHRRKRSTS